MQALIDFLKNNNARVTYGDKWLVGHEPNTWRVYQHPYGARKTITLYDGDNLFEAVSILQGDEDTE